MPVTDLSGADGLGLPPGWVIGPDGTPMQSPGAAQPYGPGGAPGPYNGGPLMPGGGVMNYQQSTPGAPSMGYPALGSPYAAPVSPAQPSPGMHPSQFATTAGLNINSNPLAKIRDWLTAHTGAPAWISEGGGVNAPAAAPTSSGRAFNVNSPAAAATAPPAAPGATAWAAKSGLPITAPTMQDGLPTSFGGGAFGGPAASFPAMPYAGGQGPLGNLTHNAPLTGVGPGQVMGWGDQKADFDVISSPGGYDRFATTGGVRRSGATNAVPGAGAPTGSPAQTPRPARAASGTPNLGYYRPTSGNARGATWTPYANPNDPRIYRGS